MDRNDQTINLSQARAQTALLVLPELPELRVETVFRVRWVCRGFRVPSVREEIEGGEEEQDPKELPVRPESEAFRDCPAEQDSLGRRDLPGLLVSEKVVCLLNTK